MVTEFHLCKDTYHRKGKKNKLENSKEKMKDDFMGKYHIFLTNSENFFSQFQKRMQS